MLSPIVKKEASSTEARCEPRSKLPKSGQQRLRVCGEDAVFSRRFRDVSSQAAQGGGSWRQKKPEAVPKMTPAVAGGGGKGVPEGLRGSAPSVHGVGCFPAAGGRRLFGIRTLRRRLVLVLFPPPRSLVPALLPARPDAPK